MITAKVRRQSGYVTPNPTIPKKELIKENLFLNPFYDDWQNYRDSFRDWFCDFKRIKKVHRDVKFYNDEMFRKRIQMNKKQKRLLQMRKARKDFQKILLTPLLIII